MREKWSDKLFFRNFNNFGKVSKRLLSKFLDRSFWIAEPKRLFRDENPGSKQMLFFYFKNGQKLVQASQYQPKILKTM